MSHWRRRAAEIADLIVWWTRMRPPTLGPGRLLCIDGRAGAGKTVLAEEVVRAASDLGTVELVHLDALLEGWGGLPTVARTLEHDVLAPLARGREGRYRCYDWRLGRFADEHVVPPADLLVVEGVGAGATSHAAWTTLLVWVEAPEEVRRRRALDRDGEAFGPHWSAWSHDEEELLARELTPRRADVVVDGTGEAEHAVVLR